jgi:GT2 family glycosyltransferase
VVRPRVDVVVPFFGSQRQLQELCSRLTQLQLRAEDTIVVVDNTPGADHRDLPGPVPVLHAAERSTPGYARNQGMAQGTAEWIVFFDADTTPADDLVESHFDPPPAQRTGLLAGAVVDAPVSRDGPAPARFAYLQDKMSQRQTFRLGPWAFSQTANVACRRAAMSAIGGFREDVRAGEDADLCYRLRRAGWEIERREGARVVHHNRETLRGFVVQKALHGAASAWLDQEYPGSFPPRRRPGLLWWAVRRSATGLLQAARRRDRDVAICALFDPLEQLAYELGRSLENRHDGTRHIRLRRR